MPSRLVALSLASVLLTLPNQASSQARGEDAYVTVAVDSILRSSAYPSAFLTPGQRGPSPEAGSDFCILYMTFDRIADVFVQGLGGREAKESSLQDERGGSHDLEAAQIRGIEFSDPSDMRSPSWVVDGGVAVLLFEMPQDVDPVSLHLRYYFKNALEEESTMMGEMEVRLGPVSLE